MQNSQCSKASTTLLDTTQLDETTSFNQLLVKTDCQASRSSSHANAWSCCQVDYNEGDKDDDNWKKLEFYSQNQKQSPSECSIGQEWSAEENPLYFDLQQRERKQTSIIKPENEFFEEEEVIEEEESKQFQEIIQAAEVRLQKEYESRKVWKQGFLEKRGGLFSWNSRFCIIKKNKLMYYKRGEIERLRGCIDFQQQECTVSENQQGTEFNIICGKKNFKFRGSKKGENIHDWVETIQQIIDSFPQKQTEKTSVQTKDQFWRYEQISLQSFLHSTKPLDIVLFRTKGWRANMLRKVTGSAVDHVGIIVEGGILECIGSKGVSITKFEEIDSKTWNELYERILIRRLLTKQTKLAAESQKLLPEIIKKVLGCKYGVKFWQIMNGKKQDNISELEEKQFFCSELVAEVLKSTKVYKQNTNSSQCLPGCFEQGKKLPLCSGFSYGNELMVNLE